jgi:DNA-directed RNA polymerase specialized sigma24 family protein
VTRPYHRSRLTAADVNELLAMARTGDREAFGELFRRYRRYAEAVARASGARDAEEAAAESFRLVVSAIDSGNGPTVAFGPYLATTVRSVARRQRQLAARHDIVEPNVFEAHVVDERDPATDPVLATAFASLPERWQSVIWYVDIEGIPPRHVVDLVGVPSSNAASALLLRARAGLRVAYLEALVGSAHTPEVRAHLAGLVAGAATTDEFDSIAAWHLERCPECRDVASRVAAITGRGSSRQLAAALVVLMGFAPDPHLIPAGTGLAMGSVPLLASVQPGWLTAAATTAVVGGVLTVVALVGGSGPAAGDAAGSSTPTASGPVGVTSAQAAGAPAGWGPSSSASPSSTTIVASSTTSSASSTVVSTTTVSSVPATLPPTIVPPAAPVAQPATEPGAVAETPPASVDPATTTLEPTTTTLPPETTTTSTTAAPQGPVGRLGGEWTIVNDDVLHIDVRISELTGEAGRIVFSAPMIFSSVSGAVCVSPTECTFSGVVQPTTITIAADSETFPITIQLIDSAGDVDASHTAG